MDTLLCTGTAPMQWTVCLFWPQTTFQINGMYWTTSNHKSYPDVNNTASITIHTIITEQSQEHFMHELMVIIAYPL